MNLKLNTTVKNLFSIDPHNNYTIECECVNKLLEGLTVTSLVNEFLTTDFGHKRLNISLDS